LTKNVDWVVYNNGTSINSGNSNQVNFKIDKPGTIEIKANSKTIYTGTITGSGIWGWIVAYWWIIAIVFVFLFILLIARGRKSKDISMT
jgi:hypothetical protein